MNDSRKSGSKLDDEVLTERIQNTASPHAGNGGPDGNRQGAVLSNRVVFNCLSRP